MRKWEDNGSKERSENILLTLIECNSVVNVMWCTQSSVERKIHCFPSVSTSSDSQQLHIYFSTFWSLLTFLTLSKALPSVAENQRSTGNIHITHIVEQASLWRWENRFPLCTNTCRGPLKAVTQWLTQTYPDIDPWRLNVFRISFATNRWFIIQSCNITTTQIHCKMDSNGGNRAHSCRHICTVLRTRTYTKADAYRNTPVFMHWVTVNMGNYVCSFVFVFATGMFTHTFTHNDTQYPCVFALSMFGMFQAIDKIKDKHTWHGDKPLDYLEY